MTRLTEEAKKAGAVELKKLGIFLAPRPKLEEDHVGIFRNSTAGDYFDGVLPTSMNRMGVSQIEALHSLCTAWLTYVTGKYVEYKAQYGYAKALKDATLSRIRQVQRDLHKEMAVTVLNQVAGDLAQIDVRYVKANVDYLSIRAMMERLEYAMKIAERNVEATSRALTAKGIVEEAHRANRGAANRYMGGRKKSGYGDTLEEGDEAGRDSDEERNSRFVAGPKQGIGEQRQAPQRFSGTEAGERRRGRPLKFSPSRGGKRSFPARS